jgi:hypothetical protein
MISSPYLLHIDTRGAFENLLGSSIDIVVENLLSKVPERPLDHLVLVVSKFLIARRDYDTHLELPGLDQTSQFHREE